MTADIPPGDPRRAAEEITKFSKAMANEALANAHKGHWKDNGMTAHDHVREAIYHAGKLLMASAAGDKSAVLEYAADVANHAMFAADVDDALDAQLTLTPAEGTESDDSKVPWGSKLPDLKQRVRDWFYNDFMKWANDGGSSDTTK